MLENNNLSYSAQNHPGVTILYHFAYDWQVNIWSRLGEMYIKFQFWGSGALYLRFETC